MEDIKTPSMNDLKKILNLLGLPEVTDEQIHAFINEEDGSEYAVWRIDQRFVLKRAKAFEIDVYRSFFTKKQIYVPSFYGFCEYDNETYFLSEYAEGKDLRYAKREPLTKALDALMAMQDEYWGNQKLSICAFTFEEAYEGVKTRSKYLGEELLEKAYAVFMERYRNVPRTLCHDDLLPFNVLVNEKAVLIDWEYGGILPYLSSFARLITHGRNEEDAFFHMREEDREFAIGYYYEKLVSKHGIFYEEYRHDLDCFLFHEYCEWIMIGNRYDNKEDERYGYCLQKARELAADITGD